MSRKSRQNAINQQAAQAAKDKMNKTRIIILCVLAVALIALIAGGVAIFGDRDSGTVADSMTAQPTAIPVPQNFEATDYIQIEVQDYGAITAELYGKEAPITVANFLKLADAGFYDGLTFHRIISGFMIQGGDPNHNGTGGSDEDIKGEFSSNGVQNDIMHLRGVLSMARSNMPDSASSQFFIMHEDAPHLDGSYAAFGKVLSGMDVVDAICQKTPVTDGNGTVTFENQPVITSVKRIEKPAE